MSAKLTDEEWRQNRLSYADLGGNIETANGKAYTYGDSQWADLLTAYDGETITYDGSGNPLSYYNGRRYTFTWAEGRRLSKSVVGGTTTTYGYDGDGLRDYKIVNGTAIYYRYASGKLLRQYNTARAQSYLGQTHFLAK